MKKRVAVIIAMILTLIVSSSYAAYNTLPEKMYKQLAIGSGLKGTVSIHAEGEKFNTPFLRTVSGAEFNLRGEVSVPSNDLYFYLFQDDEGNQTAMSELYRKEGVYYFRSDMVPGKTLLFPTSVQFLESLFPVKGENLSPAAFIMNIISLPENDVKQNWDPVLTKYQNNLEMWLAGYTVNAETVKQDNGVSALVFSYEIPMSDVNKQIIQLFSELTTDPEVIALLDTVMTQEEKDLYLNHNLIYFYTETLKSINTDSTLKMNKRVSALGEVLGFRLELPMDEKSTGCQMFSMEMTEGNTIYTLQKQNQVTVLGLPVTENNEAQSYDRTYWFSRVSSDTDKDNISVRIEINKTNETFKTQNAKDEEISNEKNLYKVNIVHDTRYLPEGTDTSKLQEFETMTADVEMHYSSKYAQSSGTKLVINASVHQGESVMTAKAEVSTVKNWPFIPFEIIDPVYTETDTKSVLAPYLEEWTANARSMLKYLPDEAENPDSSLNDAAENNAQPENETESGNDTESVQDNESDQE